MLDEPVRKLAHVHQPVLVHADVHKRAEVDHVAHRTCQLHAGLQVLHAHHVGAQQRRGQLVAHIPPGAQQLGNDVLQGRFTRSGLGAQPRKADLLCLLRQRGNGVGANVLCRKAAELQQLFRSRVTLGVHGGAVQRVLRARQPQKARALLKGLGPQALHLFQLGAAGKGPVLLPPGHHVFGRGGRKPRHPGQQRRAGGVQIHAHRVHAVLHHAVQRVGQALLGHVVLVLAHPHGLGVDLHQLGQRVLQPAGNAHRAAQVHVVLGKLLGGQLAGGIHARARLAHHHILHSAAQFADHLGRKDLGLAPGGAVADGNDLHPVLFN